MRRNIIAISSILAATCVALLIMGTDFCFGQSQTEEETKEGQMVEDTIRPSFVINEIQASNVTCLQARDGGLYDWIEIMNVSPDSLSLKGWSLSRDTSSLGTWKFPDMGLKSGGCFVVYASKQDAFFPNGDLHTDFKLKKEGGSVFLADDKGRIVSSVSYDKMKADQSLQRMEDGSYEKTYYCTPWFANTEEGLESSYTRMEQQRPDSLLIWEVMSKNGTHAKQSNGRGYDWVEVKNVCDKTISLKGYTLSDDSDDPLKYALPDSKLAPGKTMVFIASDKKGMSTSAYPHTNFKINKGSTVILSKDGEFVDGVCSKLTYYGTSIGRITGKDGWWYFSSPSPKEENKSEGFRKISSDPEFLTSPGIYNESDSLVIKLATGGSTVYYTTNGDIPTTKSSVFQDSIIIHKTAVIKAFSTTDGMMRSKLASATYLLNENNSLPVMSITADNADLYDFNKGIYAMGPGASPEFPHPGANFWKDWEKKAHIEFFDGNDGFSLDCGLKIFGAYSRGRDKKSFHIKFSDKYGKNNIDYDLFKDGQSPQHFSSFVLRSGSQDDNKNMLRDEFFTQLMHEKCPTLYVQANRPVCVYVNGEYFGVYYIREKVNAEYVANHLNVPEESVSLLFGNYKPLAGSAQEYKELLDYLLKHDMKDPECYAYVQERMDFMSLIDFKIGQYFSGNADTGNVKFFKSSDPSCDGKWYHIYYDLDWAFYGHNPLSFYLRKEGKYLFPYINSFISKLLTNDEFKDLFLSRMSFHMRETFAPENTTRLFDEYVERIKAEMPRNCKRWPKMSYTSWEKNTVIFREKLEGRRDVMLKDIRTYFHMSQEEYDRYFSGL